MIAPKQKPVTKRVAVICKDESSFGDFMSNFQISMMSRAKFKFWTNKGTTEYFMVTHLGQLHNIQSVIMTEGCSELMGYYLAADKAVQAGLAAPVEEETIEDLVSLKQEEVAHNE